MTWKRAGGVGMAAAIVVHVLFFSRHLSSVWVFPGLIAHPLIAGIHGGEPNGAIEILASVAEILVNAAFYMVVLYAAMGVLQRRRA